MKSFCFSIALYNLPLSLGDNSGNKDSSSLTLTSSPVVVEPSSLDLPSGFLHFPEELPFEQLESSEFSFSPGLSQLPSQSSSDGGEGTCLSITFNTLIAVSTTSLVDFNLEILARLIIE